jgi:hypothetical protein
MQVNEVVETANLVASRSCKHACLRSFTFKIVAAELCKKRIMTGDEVAALIGVTNPTEEQILGKEA